MKATYRIACILAQWFVFEESSFHDIITTRVCVFSIINLMTRKRCALGHLRLAPSSLRLDSAIVLPWPLRELSMCNSLWVPLDGVRNSWFRHSTWEINCRNPPIKDM